MVFAELASRISHRFQNMRDGDGFIGDAEWGSGLSDRCHAGPKRKFASDEVRPSGGATRFCVIVGEAHPLGGQTVEIGCPPGHNALVIDPDIGPADVVGHDDEDIRPPSDCLLLRLRRLDRGRRSHRRSGGERCAGEKKIAPADSTILRTGFVANILAAAHGLLLFCPCIGTIRSRDGCIDCSGVSHSGIQSGSCRCRCAWRAAGR